jgi:hypothetical protein
VEVVLAAQLLRELVVEYSKAVELVVRPLPVVGWVVLAVKENAPAIHLVLLELALIVGPVLEHQLSLPVLLPVKSSSLVSAPVLVGLDSID